LVLWSLSVKVASGAVLLAPSVNEAGVAVAASGEGDTVMVVVALARLPPSSKAVTWTV
jgi:hypothetical protein